MQDTRTGKVGRRSCTKEDLKPREAMEYEREFLLKKSQDLDMGFEKFVETYLEDMKLRLKYNTYLSKVHIIKTKIVPYFEDKSLSEITSSDIMQWQNEILQMRDEEGKGYSPTYLKTISAQMSAIFNHAFRYYDLPKNPCKMVGNMGKRRPRKCFSGRLMSTTNLQR